MPITPSFISSKIIFCKIFTKTKLTDDPYHLLLRALNFQVDILETEKLSYMIRLTYKFGYVTRLIHGLNPLPYDLSSNSMGPKRKQDRPAFEPFHGCKVQLA